MYSWRWGADAQHRRLGALKRLAWETDHAGFIKVDDELRTNVSGIWALGDCNGKGAFHPYRVQ